LPSLLPPNQSHLPGFSRQNQKDVMIDNQHFVLEKQFLEFARAKSPK
jgi:hypothetical protein